jgi:ABC-type molybdate transport system ATPase subunit
MMDEPFQSIGVEAKKRIIEHIKNTQPDMTLLFVTHIADEVPLLADSVLFFQDSILEKPVELAAEGFHVAIPRITTSGFERTN